MQTPTASKPPTLPQIALAAYPKCLAYIRKSLRTSRDNETRFSSRLTDFGEQSILDEIIGHA
jgi:hypothetical protein